MTSSDDRLAPWQQRRARRLRQLSWLRSEQRQGHQPVWYVADELLVRTDHRQAAERVLRRHGTSAVAEQGEPAPGLIRLRAPGLDVPRAARELRAQARADGDTVLAASPNHVFMSTPFEHGGPFGPPVAADRHDFTLNAPDPAAAVGVAVIDTGVWRDSPLPPAAYQAAAQDYDVQVDVDLDGVIDGDVGHANFIVGVIARHTGAARTRVLRALDTFGVCTEADLAAALARVTDESLVNLSLGAFTLDDEPPLALRDALGALLTGRDRLVVAAAGNEGVRDRPFWPAAFAASAEPWHGQVVAVAAHDGEGLCEWSNAGGWVSLTAPGADVTSTYVNHSLFPGGWAVWSGTSFATPHVVAALAQRATKAGSMANALDEVTAEAATHHFGGYPGLL